MGAVKRQVHDTAVEARRELTNHFTVEGEPFEWVEAFKYIGRLLLSMDNVDRQAINASLKKA